MMRRRWLRWLPAVVIPVVIVASVLVARVGADADTGVPSSSPSAVLAKLAGSSARTFSGTLSESSDLGLPQLPQELSGATSGATGIASALSFLTSDHTIRVYTDGPTRLRLQVLDSLAERDLVVHGDTVWLYDSHNDTATKWTAPSADALKKTPGSAAASLTPRQWADHLLATVGPSTRVSLGSGVKVAGRSAYQLVFTPRSTTTLVRSVTLAVDVSTGIPLAVTVTARGQATPAFRTAFTSFSTAAIPASRFDFTPPAGATVSTHAVQPSKGHATAQPKATAPTITGSGWNAIATLRPGKATAGILGSSLLRRLTTATADGRELDCSLFSVLITHDGRVLLGAVTPAALRAAAG